MSEGLSPANKEAATKVTKGVSTPARKHLLHDDLVQRFFCPIDLETTGMTLAYPLMLTTPRLILRDFIKSDWEAVLDYQQDPLYLRYNEWTSRTPDEVRAFVQMFIDHQRQEPRIKFQFAVTLKPTGQLIGNCGVRRDSAEAQEADIGYELDPRFWGKGYATEAARAVLHFGFTQMNVHRLTAWCVADNTASAHVLEKLGMRQEGRLREHQYFKGRWWDTLLYAILYDEWQAQDKDYKSESI